MIGADLMLAATDLAVYIVMYLGDKGTAHIFTYTSHSIPHCFGLHLKFSKLDHCTFFKHVVLNLWLFCNVTGLLTKYIFWQTSPFLSSRTSFVFILSGSFWALGLFSNRAVTWASLSWFSAPNSNLWVFCETVAFVKRVCWISDQGCKWVVWLCCSDLREG